MRCPDCNKFVPLTTEDPEEQSSDFTQNRENHTLELTAEVTVDRNCEECGTSMKTGNFSLDDTVLYDAKHSAEGHDVEADNFEYEIQERSKGTGRRAAHLFQVVATCDIGCSCGENIVSGHNFASDELQASEFDENV